MQNIQTLIKLGFKRNKNWSNEIFTSYRLELNKVIFRAHVWDQEKGFPNEKQFVSIGIVVKDSLVDKWRDCCSKDSVDKFIKSNS
jgi:hypothetical protein